MYSDFYEIPLPALRFEKVEETDTKKVKTTTPKRNDAFSKFDNVKKQKENDAQRKADSLVRKRHAKKTQKTLPEPKHLL